MTKWDRHPRRILGDRFQMALRMKEELATANGIQV
jgi:hypothetical protein